MAGAAIWNQIPPALEAGQTGAQRNAASRYAEQPLHRVLLRIARGRVVHRPPARAGPCPRVSAPPAPPATAASPFLWKPLSPHQGSPDEPVHVNARRVRRTKASRSAHRAAMAADGMNSRLSYLQHPAARTDSTPQGTGLALSFPGPCRGRPWLRRKLSAIGRSRVTT